MAVTKLSALVAVNILILKISAALPDDDAALVYQDLEHRDKLLNMLETKLKEVKESKKKNQGTRVGNCGTLPKDVDIRLKANGISGVGETDLLVKYGKNGNGKINLSANGISNVGKAQVELGDGEGGFVIPGLGNLFLGTLSRKICDDSQINEETTTLRPVNQIKSRRSDAKDAAVQVENKTSVVNGTNTTAALVTEIARVKETSPNVLNNTDVTTSNVMTSTQANTPCTNNAPTTEVSTTSSAFTVKV